MGLGCAETLFTNEVCASEYSGGAMNSGSLDQKRLSANSLTALA